jgi:hypothetical protein
MGAMGRGGVMQEKIEEFKKFLESRARESITKMIGAKAGIVRSRESEDIAEKFEAFDSASKAIGEAEVWQEVLREFERAFEGKRMGQWWKFWRF